MPQFFAHTWASHATSSFCSRPPSLVLVFCYVVVRQFISIITDKLQTTGAMEGVETAGAAAAGAAATAAAQSAVVPSPMGSITIPTEDAAAPRLDVSDKLVDKKVVDHKVAKARGAGERVKHGKTRSLECGGNALCVHGRRKYGCKECGGELVVSLCSILRVEKLPH